MVFSKPRVTLKEPNASTLDNPIATKACDGFIDEEEQAEPLETAIPLISSFRTIDSPSIYLKEKLQLPGSLFSGWPLYLTSSILFSNLFLRYSLIPVSFLIFVSMFLW